MGSDPVAKLAKAAFPEEPVSEGEMPSPREEEDYRVGSEDLDGTVVKILHALLPMRTVGQDYAEIRSWDLQLFEGLTEGLEDKACQKVWKRFEQMTEQSTLGQRWRVLCSSVGEFPHPSEDAVVWSRYYHFLAKELWGMNRLAMKGPNARLALLKIERHRHHFEALLGCWRKRDVSPYPVPKDLLTLTRMLVGRTMHILEPTCGINLLMDFYDGMVQCASQDDLKKEDPMLYIQTKNDYLRQMFRSDLESEAVESMIKEAKALLEFTEGTVEAGSKIVAQVLTTLANLHCKVDKFESALHLYTKAKMMLEDLSDDQGAWEIGWWQAYITYCEAAAYAAEGDHEEAVEKCDESIAMWQAWYENSDNPCAADALFRKAAVLKSRKRYADALTAFSSCLNIRRSLHGSNHPAVAHTLYQIGCVHWCRHNYESAMAAHRESLTIRRELYGEEHAEVAHSYHTMASVLSDWNRVPEAMDSYRKALKLRRKVFGNKNADVAQSLNNLAALYTRQERYDEAVAIHQEALAIRRELYPKDHVETAQSIYNIAIVYKTNSKYDDALARFNECLQMYRRLSKNGEAEQQIADSLFNIAEVYNKKQMYQDSLERYQESLEIYKSIHGTYHADCADTINNLAGLSLRQNRFEDALVLYEESLDIRYRVYGRAHSKLAKSMDNIALCFKSQKKFEDALNVYLNSLEMKRKLHSRDLELATALENVGHCYMSLMEKEEGQRYLREAHQIRSGAAAGRT